MKSVLLTTALVFTFALPAMAQTPPSDPALAPLTPLPEPPKPAPRAGRAVKALAPGKPQTLPKPSKEDLAAQRRLEHDMRICIGC